MSDARQPTAALLTRRQGLAALFIGAPALAVAACSSQGGPAPSSTESGPVSLPAQVAAQESALIARYDTLITAFPSIAAGLTAVRDQHAEHLAALASEPSPASSGTEQQPATESAAIDELIAAERAAMRERIDACVEASDPALARTLAFIAASEGSHIPALKDLRA